MNCSVTGVVCDVMRDDAIAVLFRNDARNMSVDALCFESKRMHSEEVILKRIKLYPPRNEFILACGLSDIAVLFRNDSSEGLCSARHATLSSLREANF